MEEEKKKKVVVVGGGTGTYTVLTGLKEYRDTIDLAAVVAMTDSGGSTGRLRDEFGYLPVGDVRMALTALASNENNEDALLRKLFLHRFATDGAVSGHTFGNLFLVALTDILGSEDAAIEAASRVLRVCGEVIPVTAQKVHLQATYDDGSVVTGEHEIDEPAQTISRRIVRVGITPEAQIHPKAADALTHADCIIFGPGDLYTSILANCVIPGFREALEKSHAKIIYVANLMTKRGQTDGMHLADQVLELVQYVGRTPDIILANSTPLPEELCARYAEEGEFPTYLSEHCEGSYIYLADLLASEEVGKTKGDVLRRSLIRHDHQKLARALISFL